MPKSKYSAVFYLLLVFLSGALVGSFGYRLYSVTTVTATPQKRPDPIAWRKHYMEEMSPLKLDDEQTKQLNQILDDTRAAVDQIRSRERQEVQSLTDSQIERIWAMLREEQKPEYAKIRAERDKRRKAQTNSR